MGTISNFQVSGQNASALFTLKLYRGEGMTLIAMNWKDGKPSDNFVGFAISYKEPGGQQFFPLKNRLSFSGPAGAVNPNSLSTRLSPIQKFRWIHFPFHADLKGDFVYRVEPVFMNDKDELSYGDFQEASIQLQQETYPGQLNVTFTRGFVSSQAFVDRYESAGPISTLLPPKAAQGLAFKPTHPNAAAALDWMGFEARKAILNLLDQAIADVTAKVYVIAYDFNEPEVVSRIEKLGNRVKVIIDDSGTHKKPPPTAENDAEQRLVISAGRANVKRQHMGQLQHNKTIIVDGTQVKVALGGSTNISWRGFFVQNNNAMIFQGAEPVKVFLEGFNNYWDNKNQPSVFGATPSANWNDLKLAGIDAKVAFSPHNANNALLAAIADDIGQHTTSSLLFSLAFLYQTPGVILTAISKVINNSQLFVYGISDKKVGSKVGLDLLKPDGNIAPVYPSALTKDTPEPFKSEPTGGGGTRMHHKFVVIDFDKPTARVYLGSYNFSSTADTSNGENLIVIRDKRIVIAYVIEALRIFDHYHFRVAQKEAKKGGHKLVLARPPRNPGEKPWWAEDYTDNRKIRDRTLFA